MVQLSTRVRDMDPALLTHSRGREYKKVFFFCPLCRLACGVQTMQRTPTPCIVPRVCVFRCLFMYVTIFLLGNPMLLPEHSLVLCAGWWRNLMGESNMQYP